ncbi:MAG: helix-turn-helix domain-containing protein [Ignavibacteria bacterium]|nr:helix-turn-helix domain-containing protein [Ignavibacteria bacterium]
MRTPAVITFSMLWQELQEVKKLLQSVAKESLDNSIQEVSVNKASQLMKVGNTTVLELIKSGELKARTYKSNGHTRYRIRIADIRTFQEMKKRETEYVLTQPTNNHQKTMQEVIANAYAKAGIDPKKPKRSRGNLL